MRRNGGAKEKGRIARACSVLPGGGPAPTNGVRGIGEADVANSPPKLNVLDGRKWLEGPLDVLSPSPMKEVVDHGSSFASSLGHQGKHGRRELGDALPLDPMICPKTAGVAVSKIPAGGGAEDYLDVGVVLELKMPPRARVVGGLEP